MQPCHMVSVKQMCAILLSSCWSVGCKQVIAHQGITNSGSNETITRQPILNMKEVEVTRIHESHSIDWKLDILDR